MSDNQSSDSSKRTPPAFSFATLNNFIESFGNGIEIPSHIDKSVFPTSMSGGNQTYLLSSLKFLDLISENGVPSREFRTLAKGSKDEKEAEWRRIIRDKYAFVFDGLDIERTTSNLVIEKFRDQGISGDTVRKAITFFLHACKAAKIKISPHVKAPRPVSRPNGSRAKKVRQTTDAGSGSATVTPAKATTATERTPYEILIEILTAEMTDQEQEAVWTLIRYLKRQELSE